MKNRAKKMLKNHRKLFLLPILAILCLQFFPLSVKSVQIPNIQIVQPDQARIGDHITLEAILTNNSNLPISDMEIVFYTPAEFANVSGEVEIGRSITNNQGMASVTYSPRTMGEQKVIARFSGNSDYESIDVSENIIIDPGPQQYISESGITVPGVGVWIFALAVGVVWGIFFGIMILLELIARKGSRIPYQEAYHE